MYRLLKVATPLETVAEMATDWLLTTRVKVPPVPEVSAAVITVLLSCVTTLPKVSTTRTTGWPARAAPVSAPIGWFKISMRTGAPGTTRMLPEFTPTRLPALKLNW